jgi:hypothetical protein
MKQFFRIFAFLFALSYFCLNAQIFDVTRFGIGAGVSAGINEGVTRPFDLSGRVLGECHLVRYFPEKLV